MNFVAVCYATSYPFGFPSRRKLPPLEILNFLIATLSNKDKKVTIIRVYEYVSLGRSSEFMKTCHNINIVVQNTGRYASPLNGKSEIPNNTFSNITRAVLLNLIHKKELVPSPISMPSGFFFGIRIGCVVMLLTSSGMEQYLHTNTSKNEML